VVYSRLLEMADIGLFRQPHTSPCGFVGYTFRRVYFVTGGTRYGHMRGFRGIESHGSLPENGNHPFSELPSALVDEMLQHTEVLSERFHSAFEDMKAQREKWRRELKERGLLKRVAELTPPSELPTTCGVDGSFAAERLLSSDLVVAAAVAVEGLTPPSEQRYWPEPRHKVWINSEPHDEAINTVLRAITIGMELELASEAPHTVVFLDGSLTTPIICFNQAMNHVQTGSDLKTAEEMISKMPSFLRAYRKVVSSSRSDKAWVAIPKYTTRREIGSMLNLQHQIDDRGLLSFLLEPDEYTSPQSLQTPQTPWHLNTAGLGKEAEDEAEQIITSLSHVQVVYYRPYSWLPALRAEISSHVANNQMLLSTVLRAIQHQCGTPAVLEPYPLYMADRMVKHLPQAIPTFRQVITQQVAERYISDIQEVFIGLHGYRTESGV